MSRHHPFGIGLAAACITFALLLGSIADGHATRDRPPPAYTGAFGEPDCTVCHLTAPLNAGSGTVTIDGVPSEYEAGAVHSVTITLTQQQLAAAGFQLTARFADGSQAGTLAPRAADSLRTEVTTRARVQYIHHVYDGTLPVAPDTARWTLLWTAPDSGAVVFNVAANAADDDFSPLGDFIYSASMRSAARR